MSGNTWLAVYCAGILAASIAGGLIPLALKLTHQKLEIMISFIAGLMLGVGLLHMLPHALMLGLERNGSNAHGHDLVDPIMLWLLAGFLIMFLVQRMFHAHHHEPPDESHGHCEHHHGRQTAAHPASFRWTGAAAGLAIHSLMEGVAIAAAVEAGVRHAGGTWFGFSTFLVIVLHKPFDSMSISTLMSSAGYPRFKIHLVNLLFAAIVPLGILLFKAGLLSSTASTAILEMALAWSAGTFLCLSMSDLLPELQFHRHDRIKLSVALLLGLTLAWGIGRLEAAGHSQLPHAHPHQVDTDETELLHHHDHDHHHE